ncbi:HIT family protein [Hippea alviniae]|uniref:HIT family protein n=1 Tax=Hippea alviniae TaxID=1279027 RepID=UPI0003B521BA|nr:HIT domain-containing protein [Hippea alviniae]
MDKLWAPWRIGYILSDKKEDGCVFCNAFNSKNDEEKLVLFRSKHSFIIMNLYPYNAGHLMVVPNRHISNPIELTEEEQLDMFKLTNKCIEILKKVMNPDGFNLGMNLGRSAGAGIDDHIHIHIVPRWNGDTNFMPILSDTKVISESLKETYKKLKGVL